MISKNILHNLSFLFIIMMSFSCKKDVEQEQVKNEPLNIIFMIGDGMGVSQITTSFYYKDTSSNFERFKNIGFIKTSSKSHKVTDSAGGATAFATGEKSYNRAIGVSTDTIPLPTIIDYVSTRNYKTGLISLSSITDATPACFYAHVKDRSMEEDIAKQLLTSEIDFFAGGGMKFWQNRSDSVNLYSAFMDAGYLMDTALLTEDPVKDKKYGFLMAEKGLPSKIEGRGDFLPEATGLALDYLSQSDSGFFLMIEGSFIDWGGHAKNGEMVISEMLDFDKTLGIVLDYIDKHENTLLVVTADHETGGLSVGKSYQQNPLTGEIKEKPDSVAVYFTTDQHTAALVPVFAKGKGSDLFTGIYENNEINHKMKKALE